MPEQTPRYALGGQVVTLLIRPNQRRKDRPAPRFPLPRIGEYAPVNVAIRREDGTVQVRPFRGLRRTDV
ncbi:MAG: hypothetical protein ABR585_07505 [Gemmatimonadaceae bacterium]